LEKFAGAIAKNAEGDGDFFAAGQTQQTDRSVAKCSQVLRPRPIFHLAFVFAESYVAHPMRAIFDAPAASPMTKQKRRVSPLARKAGDGVLDFDRRAVFAPSRAFETASLSFIESGPNRANRDARPDACWFANAA
jgi:hypothetical protein